MPTYEYHCGSCDRSFDVVQSFHDLPLTTCEVCGGTLRKVFAPVGIVFKGSGFYKTDSRAGASRAKGGSKDDGGSAAKEPAAASGTDSPKKATDGAGAGSSDAAKPASTPAPSTTDGSKGAPTAPAAPKAG